MKSTVTAAVGPNPRDWSGVNRLFVLPTLVADNRRRRL